MTALGADLMRVVAADSARAQGTLGRRRFLGAISSPGQPQSGHPWRAAQSKTSRTHF
jgi:hypothetical protein